VFHSVIASGETVTSETVIPIDPSREPEPMAWQVDFRDASGERNARISN
jgi:hypothetical protein